MRQEGKRLMLPNDEDLQDSIAQGHGLPDYAKPDQPNFSAGQGGFEELLVAPDLYSSLKPPARGIFAKWLKVLTRPSVATFASEIPAASWGITILGVLIYTVFSTLVFILGVVPARRISNPFIFLEGALYVYTAIALILVTGLIYVIAKVAGNDTGDFATQTYLYSLYTIPLAITATLLGLVPGFGDVALFAAVIYGLLLTYYMVQAAHRLNPGSARWIVFFIFLIAVVAFFVVAIFLLSSVPLVGF